jgi:iron(III) transport system permease protein
MVELNPAGGAAALRPMAWLIGRRRHNVGGWSALALFVALLVSVPILVVFAHVFVPAGEVWRHLADTVLGAYVVNTLWLVFGVGLGVFVIGTGTAWLVTMCRFPGRALLEWGLLLPLAVPAYAIAYSYAGLFEFSGPVQSALRGWFGWSRGDYWFPNIRSVGGAAVVLAFVLYPYVYMLARAAFLEQSVCVIEIGRTLGRGPWRSFTSIALPLARPAIATGVALALMETLSDFGAVQHFGVATFTTGIFRTWFGLGDPAAAAQLAAILLAFVFLLLVGERLTRGRAQFHHTSRRYRELPRYRLRGGPAALAFLACALPIGLGFLLPGGQLLAWLSQTAGDSVDSRLWGHAANSLMLAAGASAIAVMVALLLAYGVRLNASPVARGAARVASLGYAVPGSVIAVGILIPLAWADNTLDGWLRASFGVSSGLLLSGTITALMFAYVVRFLAVSLNTVDASLAKVTPAMDGVARTLGMGPAATVARVHAPIIAPSLMTAALLVFVDVMKELPATLILRPFDFNTLAVHAFELASDEQLREAAAPALAIVAAGLIPVALLSLAISRARPGRAQTVAQP